MQTLREMLTENARGYGDKAALVFENRSYTFEEVNRRVNSLVNALSDLGVRKGDRVGILAYNCPQCFEVFGLAKAGRICVPLNFRSAGRELVYLINNSGISTLILESDFVDVVDSIRHETTEVRNFICLDAEVEGMANYEELIGRYPAHEPVDEVAVDDPAALYYTSGTTGYPKGATHTHKSLIAEIGIHRDSFGSDDVVLCVMPFFHVGGSAAHLFPAYTYGATSVIHKTFNETDVLEAIQRHKITYVGLVPAMIIRLLEHPSLDQYDLSSLEFVIYGGSSVDVPFLERMAQMAPRFGTGIGMTESAGFVSFTPPGISVEEMAGQVGQAFPDLAPITIRAPMNEDGTAGEELTDGEIGEICYEGQIVFQGYYNQPEATAQMLSKEGILYTGDLGYFKDMGSYRALYLTGREKFVIKQKGFNVFPGEVEAHIAQLEGVDAVEVVGMEHKVFDEGIVAFVREKPDAGLTPEQVMAHCEGIASYKRPQYVVVWPADQEFPLTRVAKVDKLALQATAEPIIAQLRQEGRWDAAPPEM